MSAPAPAWPISPSSSSRPVACARQRRNGLEYLVSLGGASADRPRGAGIGPCRPRHSVGLCRRSAPSAERRRSSARDADGRAVGRSEEHTTELQSTMRRSYAVFCLKKKNKNEQ